MAYLENYNGFDILRPEIPIALNMWNLTIRTDDTELDRKLKKYHEVNGPPIFTPGPLTTAVDIARAYIDAVLAIADAHD